MCVLSLVLNSRKAVACAVYSNWSFIKNRLVPDFINMSSANYWNTWKTLAEALLVSIFLPTFNMFLFAEVFSETTTHRNSEKQLFLKIFGNFQVNKSGSSFIEQLMSSLFVVQTWILRKEALKRSYSSSYVHKIYRYIKTKTFK